MGMVWLCWGWRVDENDNASLGTREDSPSRKCEVRLLSNAADPEEWRKLAAHGWLLSKVYRTMQVTRPWKLCLHMLSE